MSLPTSGSRPLARRVLDAARRRSAAGLRLGAARARATSGRVRVATSREPLVRTARAAWRAGRGDRRGLVWPEAALASTPGGAVACNVCGWVGDRFLGTEHSESAQCPVCGSIARDRFLYWCWMQRTPYSADAGVLETSPRMDERYRRKMSQRVRYTSSDYDESAHKGAIRLDLQDIALPDGGVDVVLTPHVLEHVPDTDRALSELHRVLAPGGHVLLQVPFPQARTAPPSEPEYHGDDTLVHWRFGWDLVDRTREHGFRCDVLVTAELHAAARDGRSFDYGGSDVDVDDLMSAADADGLTVVADEEQSRRHGFRPPFQFVTLHLHKPVAT